MYSFSIRNAIFLLVVLSQKFIAAYVNNVTHKGMEPAKVFTNFLKVPWINLDTSWMTEVSSSSCGNDISTLFKNADAGEMWALQMLDASSKIPAGLLLGNIRDLGMYEECIRVNADDNPAKIQGRHCMVSMAIPTKFVRDASAILYVQKLSAYNPTPNTHLHFGASLCLPSSCGNEDIAGFVNASIQGTPVLAAFEATVAQVTCSHLEAEKEYFTMGTILTISFFASVAIFLVFCTVCDFVVKFRSEDSSTSLKTLGKFSLYTNACKLLSTKIPPDTMPAIHGIRFLSMVLVVTVHRVLSGMVKPTINMIDAYLIRQSWFAPLLFILPYAVDTFFVLSGFLTAYLFLSRLRSGLKFNIAAVYIHRYLRMTPCVVALILFDIFILPLLGSGPIWEIVLEVTSGFCRKNWWTNLLYVQNFVNRQEMCLTHTWYLAVEMQLFWICPIILYPLFHRPRLGLAILSLISVASLITPAIHLVLNQYSFLFNSNKNFVQQYQEFVDSYTITYNRALPYFVGILLGYYVVNSKRTLTKVQAAFNWIMTSISILFCLWNTSFVQPNAVDYSAGWEATYVSVGRLGWSFAVAWILYACTQGHAGPIGRFLSLPMFVPLSRMSYGIYLASAVLQVGISATDRTAVYLSPFATMYLVWGDLAACIAIAFFMTLFFETPIIVLEKILKAKGTSGIIECGSIRKKQKLLAIIRNYPSLPASGRGNSDLEIETRMSQLLFWRTVSDVLNTLGRRTTKTPKELLQTWQDWKSDLSKNAGEQKTPVKSIENGSAEVDTGTATLEKELLIFLATVNYSVDDTASSIKSDITEPARSHLSPPNIQSDGLVRLPTLSSSAFPEKTSKFSDSKLTGSSYPNQNVELAA